MKNFFLLFIFFIGCSTDRNCSDFNLEMKRHSKSGYLVNFRTSQDGMSDFWFFPCCLVDKSIKSKSVSDSFFKIIFGKGISFKMPITGIYYDKIKVASTNILLDSTSFFKNVWITPVNIKVNINEKAPFNEIATMNISKITLKQGGEIQSLFYYIIDDLEIENLEVKN